MDNTKIRSEYDKAKALRKTIETTWNVIERLVMPYRGDFFKEGAGEHAVEWSKRDVYDSTAISAAQSLAATMHSSLTTPSIRWFELAFRDKDLQQNDGLATEWLQKCGQRMYDELVESNFGLEVNECYQDLVGFGTAMVSEEIEEPKWTGLNFMSVPLKNSFFSEDHKQQVYRYYRLLRWTPLQIISKFGKKGTPKHIKDMAEKSPDEEQDVIYCIFERPSLRTAPTFTNLKRRMAPKRRPYGTKYILHKSAEMLGEEGGYYELPVFIPRWRRTNDSMWGNSPAMVALPQILTLNETVKMRQTAAEKAIDPPLLTEDRNFLTDLELGAGDLSVVRKIDGVRPLESAGRFDVASMEVEDSRAMIRQIFYVDQLELKDSPAMTATEVTVRYELMQRLLGPTLDRLQSDFLDPMIKRTFNAMLRGGRFTEMPASLHSADVDLDIEYQGPLSRSQKSDSVANMQRYIQVCGEAAQLSGKPDALDAIDFTQYSFELGDMLSIPAAVMNDKTKVERENKQRDAQRKEAAEAEVGKLQGEAMQANTPPEGAGNEGIEQGAAEQGLRGVVA